MKFSSVDVRGYYKGLTGYQVRYLPNLIYFVEHQKYELVVPM